tara:strand:- start:375 stop:533 length:159 start_codon:yes stop_codon:yes gene_type:complete
MKSNKWQECQTLSRLLKQTDNELAQVKEKQEALASRRLLLKKTLNKQLSKAV